MSEQYREQHKLRMSWMPWLYFTLKPEQRTWAEAWQRDVQAHLMAMETVKIEEGCFVAPEAKIFAEPFRAVTIRSKASIGAEAFIHGPVDIGPEVSINARASIDGGSAGIVIGEGTRIATGATLYAFDHGLNPGMPIRAQGVRSRGIRIGRDVWIGANAGITDGVTVGDGAVIGMGAIVTRDVASMVIVGGVPARVIGNRSRGVPT
jgi:acetyltransferase-like isoleucine patch superfamily enzyme